MFQDLNYNLQKTLSEVLPNQQSHQKYSALTCLGCSNLLDFPLQRYVAIALALWADATARLSIHD